ncbi:MAG: hypothetical protein ACOX6U_10500 [Oscillospiraceae bacterium]|jgi:hypothetical protein
MKVQNNIGLSFHVSEQEKHVFLKQSVKLFLAELLFLGISAGFLSMAERNDLLLYLLPGVLMIGLEWLLWRLNRRLLWLNAALVFFILIIILVKLGLFLDGAGTFLNALFTASESRQAYQYEHYVVSGVDSGLVLFFVMVGIITAVLCEIILEIHRKGVIIFFVLLCLVFGVQIYFGVFPHEGWMLLLFSSSILSVGYLVSDGKGVLACLMLAVLILLISLCTFAVYPGENQTLTVWSTEIRDYLDAHISPPVSDGISSHPNYSQQQGKKEDVEENEEGFEAKKESEGFLGAHIGTIAQVESWVVTYLSVIFIAFFLLVSCRFGYRAWKMKRWRDEFNNLNPSRAIRSMFFYLIGELKAVGLQNKNVDYLEYTEQIAKLVSPVCAKDYYDAVLLWQEAEYSEHTMTEAQRMSMCSTVGRITQESYSQGGFQMKLKVKSFQLFGKEGKRRGKKKSS